jgi:hypothetical protein
MGAGSSSLHEGRCDLAAQASLREMMADRIMRAAHSGEVDRTALKALALRGL